MPLPLAHRRPQTLPQNVFSRPHYTNGISTSFRTALSDSSSFGSYRVLVWLIDLKWSMERNGDGIVLSLGQFHILRCFSLLAGFCSRLLVPAVLFLHSASTLGCPSLLLTNIRWSFDLLEKHLILLVSYFSFFSPFQLIEFCFLLFI